MENYSDVLSGVSASRNQLFRWEGWWGGRGTGGAGGVEMGKGGWRRTTNCSVVSTHHTSSCQVGGVVVEGREGEVVKCRNGEGGNGEGRGGGGGGEGKGRGKMSAGACCQKFCCLGTIPSPPPFPTYPPACHPQPTPFPMPRASRRVS